MSKKVDHAKVFLNKKPKTNAKTHPWKAGFKAVLPKIKTK